MEQMPLFHIDSESAGRKPAWVKVQRPIGSLRQAEDIRPEKG